MKPKNAAAGAMPAAAVEARCHGSRERRKGGQCYGEANESAALNGAALEDGQIRVGQRADSKSHQDQKNDD
jgi:hypothetical protein